MLYIKVISKDKHEGTYFSFNIDEVAKCSYLQCAKHKKFSTASHIELLTPTGTLLASHDYE